MKQLNDWLDRLDQLAADGEGEVEEHLKRVSAPFRLDFDQSVVRFIDPDQQIWPFASVPTQLAVMAWFDRAGSIGAIEAQTLAAQLGALLSFATNRRVEVASTDYTISMKGSTQRNFLPYLDILDRALMGPLELDPREAFEGVVRGIRGLQGDDLAAIGAAISMHYAAVLLFSTDPDAAYALAVGGIERLSRAYTESVAQWDWWDGHDHMDMTFREAGLSESQATRIRDEFVKDKQLRLRQTFARYVIEGLDSKFWETELENFVPGLTMGEDGTASMTQMARESPSKIDAVVPRDPEILRRRLLSSYDTRSIYVHSGITNERAVVSTTAQLVGRDVGRTSPVEFVGVRAILRFLIAKEIADRASPRDLPRFLSAHPTDPQ